MAPRTDGSQDHAKGRGSPTRARKPQRDDPRSRLERLQAAADGDPAAFPEVARAALSDSHPLPVARAAQLCGDRLLYALEGDLIAAFVRLRPLPYAQDPQCTAKGAIARALVALDCQDVELYRVGLRLRQAEPVWGGSVDTAVDLRATCAMGLVQTRYPRALIDLVGLLADPEPRARAGAARAIACAEPLAAEAVLRAKALMGDAEPEVTGECLAGLLQVEPEESPAFVAGFLDAADPGVREQAALALGGSRLDLALGLLRERWDAEPMKGEAQRILLRGAILHRSAAAFDWLVDVVARGDPRMAAWLVEELAVYRSNARLGERVQAAVAARARPQVSDAWRRAWGEGD
jgi:HEAT repeat protein